MDCELFDIDDLTEEIEKKYGRLEELTESDCADIIHEYVGDIELENAYFDKQLFCIFYKPKEENDGDVFLDIYLDTKRAKYLGFD